MRKRILLTDAYSTTNLGDGELVRRSLECVRGHGSVAGVLATDPDSFRKDHPGVPLLLAPMSRVAVANKSLFARSYHRGRELGGLLALLIVGVVPLSARKRRKLARSLDPFIKFGWYRQLSSVDKVVAVGGGYLGDKYSKRTLVSSFYYWSASRMGIAVETMPISISSLNRPFLEVALKIFGKDVKWRARESVTMEILERNGLHAELVPDLAWRNASPPKEDGLPNPRGSRIVVAPVGSDFYTRTEADSDRILELLELAIGHAGAGSADILFVAMHSSDNRLKDGRDDFVCNEIARSARIRWPDAQVEVAKFTSYTELVDYSRTAVIAVCERLHAGIACLSQGTPTIIRAYEPKHEGVLVAAGFPATRSGDALVVSGENLAAVAWNQKRLLDHLLPVKDSEAV